MTGVIMWLCRPNQYLNKTRKLLLLAQNSVKKYSSLKFKKGQFFLLFVEFFLSIRFVQKWLLTILVSVNIYRDSLKFPQNSAPQALKVIILLILMEKSFFYFHIHYLHEIKNMISWFLLYNNCNAIKYAESFHYSKFFSVFTEVNLI